MRNYGRIIYMNIFKNKNTIFATLLLSFLFSCGPSPEEIAAELKQRNDLATVTCNFMAESRNMDAAMRIKEISSARERLSEELYLGTDSGIVESFKYGLCKELVLNDPEYNAKLITIMEAVAEQARKDEERARIAREKAAEVARIAREKAAEVARIAREKAAEEARIAAEKKAKEDKKNMVTWSNNINSVLKEYPLDITLTKIEFDTDYSDNETIKFAYLCKNLKGLTHDVILKFKNNLGEIRAEGDSIGSCSIYGETITNGKYGMNVFTEGVTDLFYMDKPATKEVLESVHIELTGDYFWTNYKDHFDDARVRREIEKKIDRKTYNVPYGAKFDSTIIEAKYQIYP